jgi:hypothetical protein
MRSPAYIRGLTTSTVTPALANISATANGKCAPVSSKISTLFPSADAGLKPNQVTAIIRFYGAVDSMNRGLDVADRVLAGQHIDGESQEGALKQAQQRVENKARGLVEKHYQPAIHALRLKMWLFYKYS